MPVDDALMIELEALAKAEGKDSFHMWVGSENYEMRVDPARGRRGSTGGSSRSSAGEEAA